MIIEFNKNSQDSREKILSAQLLSRYFKHFSAHEDVAFESIVDLCESSDVNVRKHASMAMVAICKDCKHFVSKAADILIQLYQTNEASEVTLITSSLMTLLQLDISKFLPTFFANFEDGSEIVRERALKFLAAKLQLVDPAAMTKEVEEQLLTHSKKAMEDVTKDEFNNFINILSKLKIAKTATGQAMIVLIIKSQAGLDKEFDPKDTESLDKFLSCTSHTIPLLSQYNRASEYISYICTKILPHLPSLSGHELSVLQTLAEMSPYIHESDIPEQIDLEKCQRAVYDKLIEFMPLPAWTSAAEKEAANKSTPSEATDQAMTTDETTAAAAAETNTDEARLREEQNNKSKEVDFQFTHIEYLIHSFHQFCRIKPDFFTEDLQNNIKLRLSYLSLGCTKYMELLSVQLRVVMRGDDLKKKEENKLRSVALRTTKNISQIIKDLLKKPPQFKTSVLLSCKPLASPASAAEAGVNVSQQTNKGQNNNNGGDYNKSHYGRQAGHKHKYRQSYQNDRNNKRPRHNR